MFPTLPWWAAVAKENPGFRFGCAMWGNRHWVGRLFSQDAKVDQFLTQYSSVFSAVEGNTTFYGLPSADTVRQWNADASDDFRFSFKFPRRISHSLKLRNAESETSQFLQRMVPLGDKLGPFMLQLPASFGPEYLTFLVAYLHTLPEQFKYSVEVRHPQFYNDSDAEKRLNEVLQRGKIDRVMFDSRPLFSVTARSKEVREAQEKKPKVPANTYALAKHPILRFIGHPHLESNLSYFRPWMRKLVHWIEEGREPYVFLHMADNADGPELALAFYESLREFIDDLPTLPDVPLVAQSDAVDHALRRKGEQRLSDDEPSKDYLAPEDDESQLDLF